MPLNISTNTAALRAGSYLSQNNQLLQRSMDRLASGKKITTPVGDPGSLAVSMKLSASINRLGGAVNNIQNAQSFLEVQDGMLDTVGRIVDRMSELKGLASQDPMKSSQDRASYNNEFKDLQVQLYNISQQTFNGMSLFANHKTDVNGVASGGSSNQVLFNAKDTDRSLDNTIDIYTSGQGSSGSKVSIHKAVLLSALTVKGDRSLAGDGTNSDGAIGVSDWDSVTSVADKSAYTPSGNQWVTFAAEEIADTIELDMISVGVITQALENIAYLRAQNGGSQSRLAFNLESLTQQKTNMRAALGRIVDVDIAEESTNLAKYSILNQAAASMLSQANSSMDVALMLLR
jgi:flagellin